MPEQYTDEFWNARHELKQAREEHEERYGEYKDGTDKLATVFTFKPTDFLLNNFYFTLEGVSLSLPYPTLATFNHITNIVPNEPTPELLAVWGFHAVWILAVADKKGEEWLSFRKSYGDSVYQAISQHYAYKRMEMDMRHAFLPFKHRKKIHLLFEGFILLMDDIGERMGTEKHTQIDYPQCYTLLGETETIFNTAKDFGMLPHVFMDSINIAEFASIISSVDRLSETERRVMDAQMADTGGDSPDNIGY